MAVAARVMEGMRTRVESAVPTALGGKKDNPPWLDRLRDATLPARQRLEAARSVATEVVQSKFVDPYMREPGLARMGDAAVTEWRQHLEQRKSRPRPEARVVTPEQNQRRIQETIDRLHTMQEKGELRFGASPVAIEARLQALMNIPDNPAVGDALYLTDAYLRGNIEMRPYRALMAEMIGPQIDDIADQIEPSVQDSEQRWDKTKRHPQRRARIQQRIMTDMQQLVDEGRLASSDYSSAVGMLEDPNVDARTVALLTEVASGNLTLEQYRQLVNGSIRGNASPVRGASRSVVRSSQPDAQAAPTESAADRVAREAREQSDREASGKRWQKLDEGSRDVNPPQNAPKTPDQEREEERVSQATAARRGVGAVMRERGVEGFSTGRTSTVRRQRLGERIRNYLDPVRAPEAQPQGERINPVTREVARQILVDGVNDPAEIARNLSDQVGRPVSQAQIEGTINDLRERGLIDNDGAIIDRDRLNRFTVEGFNPQDSPLDNNEDPYYSPAFRRRNPKAGANAVYQDRRSREVRAAVQAWEQEQADAAQRAENRRRNVERVSGGAGVTEDREPDVLVPGRGLVSAQDAERVQREEARVNTPEGRARAALAEQRQERLRQRVDAANAASMTQNIEFPTGNTAEDRAARAAAAREVNRRDRAERERQQFVNSVWHVMEKANIPLEVDNKNIDRVVDALQKNGYPILPTDMGTRVELQNVISEARGQQARSESAALQARIAADTTAQQSRVTEDSELADINRLASEIQQERENPGIAQRVVNAVRSRISARQESSPVSQAPEAQATQPSAQQRDAERQQRAAQRRQRMAERMGEQNIVIPRRGDTAGIAAARQQLREREAAQDQDNTVA